MRSGADAAKIAASPTLITLLALEHSTPPCPKKTESGVAGLFNDPIVRWHRNIFSHVPSTKMREIAAMLKVIHTSEDVVAAREKDIRVIEKLRGFCLTKAAEFAKAVLRPP